MNRLNLAAYVDAASALDALIRIPDHTVQRIICLIVMFMLDIRQYIYMILSVKSLQLTEAVSLAVAPEAHLAELRVK